MTPCRPATSSARARSTPALRPIYEVLRQDQPDPGQGRPGAARDLLGSGAGCRSSRPTTSRGPRSGGRWRRTACWRGAPRRFEQLRASGSFPWAGLGEIGKNMTVVEVEGRIVVVDTGLMFPTADMLGIDLVLPDFSTPARARRRHRGDRPHPRPRGPRRRAALRAARDRHAAGDLRRPAHDRHGPLQARRAQAARRAAARSCPPASRCRRARSRSSWSTWPTRSPTRARSR